MKPSPACLVAGLLAGCTVAANESSAVSAPSAEVAVATPPPVESAGDARAGPAEFVFAGELTQGGWIRGRVPAGTVSARLGDAELELDHEGRFFAGFDRDAGSFAGLSATTREGAIVTKRLEVGPRSWAIEHINASRRPSGPSEDFMARRRPELERIAAARAVNAESDGWKQAFIWPVAGRISGRFGSQRIYRGEPGSYHSGLDITTGTSGTPYVAPADGVVVLAAETPFSLEGKLLIIDHGMGLNSAFLHSSKLAVKEGDRVRQGQPIGYIGATGRVTGPHLHWSIKWREARLDPLLFVGPVE